MSDRLVLYNPRTNQYVIFAKDFGEGFGLGNIELLREFLSRSFSSDKIEIGDLDILPDSAETINKEGHWNYYEPESET